MYAIVRCTLTRLLFALPALAAAQVQTPLVGYVTKPQYDWVMHCQGCHGADALGTPGSVPRLAGTVARFLKVEAGRAYLGRVPGVAFAALSDSDVAALLNWVVLRFDFDHVPQGFTPYSREEIGQLRRSPLISHAYRERRRLLQLLAAER